LLDYATSKASDGLSKIGETLLEDQSDDDYEEQEAVEININTNSRPGSKIGSEAIEEGTYEAPNTQIRKFMKSMINKHARSEPDAELALPRKVIEEAKVDSDNFNTPKKSSERSRSLQRSSNKSDKMRQPVQIKVDLTAGDSVSDWIQNQDLKRKDES